MKKDKRLELYCEGCGERFDRWDIDLVEPAEEFILTSDDFNFACPECVAKYELIPIQSETATRFRHRNELIRQQFAPIPVIH